MNSFDGKNSPQNQLFIDVCGCQTINNSDEHMHQFRWSDYHILYAVEGNGYVKIDGKSVELSAGTLLMFLPLQYRDYGFSKEKRSKFYYIHFNGEMCKELISDLKLDGVTLFRIGINPVLTGLMNELIDEFEQKSRYYEYMCQSRLLNILTFISRKHFTVPREHSQAKEQIDEICRHIYANCDKIESVNELAQICHLSESRFTHLFSATVGISPKAYLLAARIDVAKEMLTNSDHSIGYVSAAVGFGDQNYFSRVFKRFTKLSPTEYRRVYANKQSGK